VKSRTNPPQFQPPPELSSVDLRVLQSLFDQTPDVAFFVKDSEGRYIAVNESLIARHGLKQKSDAIGKRPQDICPGDLGRIPTEQDSRVLRTGRSLIGCLELQWHRPREPVWCLTSKFPLLNAAGQIVGLIGLSQDVRAPVGAEEIPQEFAAALADFEQDPSSDVTPAVLAKRSRLSPPRLARLTRRLFGLTPSQLIAKTRITAASRLLLETQQSVAEIAHHCGYNDQSAFTRAFRTTTGLTPLEYRRRERVVRESVGSISAD
jgi:AraC-like DNA-binding protein